MFDHMTISPPTSGSWKSILRWISHRLKSHNVTRSVPMLLLLLVDHVLPVIMYDFILLHFEIKQIVLHACPLCLSVVRL